MFVIRERLYAHPVLIDFLLELWLLELASILRYGYSA